jgi:hypothetical protein
LKRADLVGYEPKRPGKGSTLHENIGPESTQTPHSEREIQFLVLFKAMLLSISQDAVTKLPGVLGLQGRVLQRDQLTPHANHWWNSGSYMQVRSSPFNHLFQKIVKACQNLIPFGGKSVARENSGLMSIQEPCNTG